MALISSVKSFKTGADSKKRIFDPFNYKPQWADKAVLEPIEVDLAADNGFTSESDFYRTSRPILFLVKAVGRLPIHMESGWMRYSYKSLPFYYSLSLAIIHVALMIYYRATFRNAWNKLSSPDRGNHTFESIMFSCLVVMQVPTFLVIIYSWFVEVPAVVRCYNITAVVEKRISDVFPSCAFRARTRAMVTASVVLYFVGVLAVVSLLLTSRFDQAPWFTIATFTFNFTSSHSICIGWCFNFLFLTSLASRLKKHMVMCLKQEENRLSKLKICRKMWMAVWKLSRKYADAFAITLILILITDGIIFVIAIYGMVAVIRSDTSILERLTIAPYLIYSFLNVASVFETAHRARNMLGDRFIGTLMAMDKDNLDRECIEEVDRFMSMISFTENARITLKGYVTVDRALLVSFLSYSVTYLIVLIQFQEKTNESNEVLMASNNTIDS